MPVNIPYKSFCWCLGTTSFRTKNFNRTIEEQLRLLHEFWAVPENKFVDWNDSTQAAYYDFMKSSDFVTGSAPNKAKDAREKTSGLVDIGLVDKNRKLTEVGEFLLEISLKGDFTIDNILQIPKDSFIYLKQLLKTCNDVGGDYVRPFVVLLYVLSKLEYLTREEFTFLLPLCTNEEYTEYIIDEIKRLRENETSIDEVIIDRLMKMDNYKSAFELYMSQKVDKELICTIGMNRKSRSYDIPYFDLYTKLYDVYVKKDSKAIMGLFDAVSKINIYRYWRNFLFTSSLRKTVEKSPEKSLRQNPFTEINGEKRFKEEFFKYMHLFKAKATLSDYLDLNRRYIKTTDIILFIDNQVKLDIVPKQFFDSVADELYEIAFCSTDRLFYNCDLDEIATCLDVSESTIIEGLNRELGVSISTMSEAYDIVDEERYQRLNHLIDTKFTDTQLIKYLGWFEERYDAGLLGEITDNADVPTIFEYVLAIIWYKISDRAGRVLDYMKLSLDANLLPKTHAAGGDADIVYEYEETKYYPKHTMLLEATLADKTNQRRMEMEPVSRHLGQHLIKTGNLNSYCVFVTTFLNINVISDFRARKNIPYYDTNDHSKYVAGMKIIPLGTAELKGLLLNNVKYKDIYVRFEKAHESEFMPHEWYDKYIRNWFSI